MKRRLLLSALSALAARSALAQNRPGALSLVAAENVYGDIARQLAGPRAAVTSVLSNPDQDPHLFEASPSVARALSAADIVVVNGADYDPWMTRLLKAAKSARRRVVVVAELARSKPGDNPHLWYDTTTVATAARAISAALTAADPPHEADFAAQLQTFLDSLAPLDARIAELRARHAGQIVTATEPVFGYMATALGLVMRNERFQLAVMNETEPSASDVAAFETDLRQHRVRVLLYNSQATTQAAERLLGIARQEAIPIVPITETMPAGQTYQSWMLGQLEALAAALAQP
jgi:zinc/manganese transport system substrate-binding protein